MLENFAKAIQPENLENQKFDKLEQKDPFKLPDIKDLPALDDKKMVEFKQPDIKDLPPLNCKDSRDSDDGVKRIPCRNEGLAGQEHPVTGVPFNEKEVVNDKGEKVIGVFAEFESVVDVQLPEDLHNATDKEQFKECNKQLKEKVENDPELRDKFTDEQLEQIENGDTPDGYTWHHSEDTGKMQLVDTETHAKTGHTGGKAVWGGGSENR